MKSRNITPIMILVEMPVATATGGNEDFNRFTYIAGAVIALFLLGYLIYALLKPDKF